MEMGKSLAFLLFISLFFNSLLSAQEKFVQLVLLPTIQMHFREDIQVAGRKMDYTFIVIQLMPDLPIFKH